MTNSKNNSTNYKVVTVSNSGPVKNDKEIKTIGDNLHNSASRARNDVKPEAIKLHWPFHLEKSAYSYSTMLIGFSSMNGYLFLNQEAFTKFGKKINNGDFGYIIGMGKLMRKTNKGFVKIPLDENGEKIFLALVAKTVNKK